MGVSPRTSYHRGTEAQRKTTVLWISVLNSLLNLILGRMRKSKIESSSRWSLVVGKIWRGVSVLRELSGGVKRNHDGY
jgi:hypothetical protein